MRVSSRDQTLAGTPKSAPGRDPSVTGIASSSLGLEGILFSGDPRSPWALGQVRVIE